MMRYFLMLLMLIAPVHAVGQQGVDTAGKVTELSRHVSEMRELLNTRDPAVRDAAVETALQDPSPAIRGMAIYYALRRYDRLPLGFALPAGSPIRREDLPSLVLGDVKWSEDGRSLSAVGAECGGNTTHGQVTGDRLRLQFVKICLSSDLSGAASSQPGAKPTAIPYFGCETELTPTPGRDALTGALRCPGVSIALPLSLPLG
jgi:hypothetical protein